MKQIYIHDVQANFEQVLDDMLLRGEPVKIKTGAVGYDRLHTALRLRAMRPVSYKFTFVMFES